MTPDNITEPSSAAETASTANQAERPKLLPEQQPQPSAETAAEHIANWYDRLDPVLADHLTDPNVVLTLAGARGLTEFYVDDSPTDTNQAFAQLNANSEIDGVRFVARTQTNRISGRTKSVVGIQNLAGYQRATGQTALPGIPRFDAGDGFSAIDDWYAEAVQGIMAASEHGSYPGEVSLTQAMHIVDGVLRGYPDAAVMSAMFEPVPADGEHTKLIHTDIREANHYPNAQPNFLYDPKDEAVVAPVVAEWGKILEDYYQSETHQAVAARPEFRAERAAPERQPNPAAQAETRRFLSLLDEARQAQSEMERLSRDAMEIARRLKRPDFIRDIILGKTARFAELPAATEGEADADKLTQLREIGRQYDHTQSQYSHIEDELDAMRDAQRTKVAAEAAQVLDSSA